MTHGTPPVQRATVRLGPWALRAQPETTRRLCAQAASAGPAQCDCAYCRNWVAVREQVCPPAYRHFLTALGTDWHHEEEVVHYGRLPAGHHYGGWLYVVAELLEGPDAHAPFASKDGFEVRLEPLEGTFSMGVSRRTSVTPYNLEGLPLLQLEFSVIAPWVLAEPEPDEA